MAVITYEITANGSTLADYQSFTVTKGRQQVQDPFKSGTATITGRDISNVSALNISDRLTIRVTHINGSPASYTVFDGLIANVTANYGFDANMDTWSIEADDSLAEAGRSYMSNFFSAGATTVIAAIFAASGTGVAIFNPGPVGSSSTVSAQSFDNTNLLDVLNQLIATEQGRLVAVEPYSISFYSRNILNEFGELCNFTDGSVASALPALKYQDVVFRSRADSFFTKTIVEPEGLAAQSAGSGSRVFTMKSYDQTITQAGDLAAYALATLDVSQDVPASIAFIAENQLAASVEFGLKASSFLTLSGLQSVLVTLRGTQYPCFVEGVTVSADPSQTRFTLNLSSSDAAVGFVLDDAILGVLDTNKLGF